MPLVQRFARANEHDSYGEPGDERQRAGRLRASARGHGIERVNCDSLVRDARVPFAQATPDLGYPVNGGRPIEDGDGLPSPDSEIRAGTIEKPPDDLRAAAAFLAGKHSRELFDGIEGRGVDIEQRPRNQVSQAAGYTRRSRRKNALQKNRSLGRGQSRIAGAAGHRPIRFQIHVVRRRRSKRWLNPGLRSHRLAVAVNQLLRDGGCLLGPQQDARPVQLSQ
jgi:hypothetical protein